MYNKILYILIVSIIAYSMNRYDDYDGKKILSRSVVHIISKNDESAVMGNGIIIDYQNNNYILTNSHVCNLNESSILSIKSKNDFFEFKNDGKSFFTHDEYDLCLIKMNSYNIGYYKIKDNKVKDYSKANYLGFRNNKLTLIKGQESLQHRSIATINQKIYNFNPLEGDSGSLVFNDDYKLIGILKSKMIRNNQYMGGVITDLAIFDFLKRAEGFIPLLQQVP